jgi:hypothetical protein
MTYKTKAAQAAAQIREILKKEFPTTKFSVKSDNFSMGDSVNVSWIDGVAPRKVEKLISHYQYGKFNGMEDIYECTNRRDDIPQTKWLSCNREVSDAVYLSKLEELRGKWDVLANVRPENIRETNREIFDKTTFWTARDFIYSQFRGFEEIDILPEKEEPKKEALIDAGKLGCKLVDYSEKAVALFGNTKPLKEKLKELGGRFNPFLNNNGEKMAGWIFPKSKLSQLETILN